MTPSAGSHSEPRAHKLTTTMDNSKKHRYDVYGVGNALVDTEVQVEEPLLARFALKKGMMTLAGLPDQRQILDELKAHPKAAAAGGSAANTIVGVAQFGGRTYYTGKVGNDMAGALYRESMAEFGVELDVDAADDPTGTCVILVTPDGERTMQTCLGASSALTASDIDDDRLAESKILYVEGYLWGSPSTRDAALHAMEVARANAVRVALSLSDPAMVEFKADEFRQATREMVDILFCNEHEASIYVGGGTRDQLLRAIGKDCPHVFMTCGGDGSMALDGERIVAIPGYKVPVVDTTGAGDVYAAGVLYGLTHGLSVAQAGRLGSFASALIVTELGPRLKRPLADRIEAILDGAHPVGRQPNT